MYIHLPPNQSSGHVSVLVIYHRPHWHTFSCRAVESLRPRLPREALVVSLACSSDVVHLILWQLYVELFVRIAIQMPVGGPMLVVTLAFSSDVVHVMLQDLSVELFVRASPSQSIQPGRRDRMLSHHSANGEREPKGSDTRKQCSGRHVRMD